MPTLNQCCKATPQNLILHHACVPTHPEPTSQDTVQTSIGKCSSHTSLFLNFAGAALGTYYTTHVCQPILNQCSKDTLQNFRSENFHLTHPCFELCRNNSEQMTPRMCANPEPTFQRYSHKTTSDPKIFISHIPVLNFAGTALHITPHM